MDDLELTPLRTVLAVHARRWGWANPLETASLFGRWREIVGDQVASRCQPVGVAQGILKVAAATPAWARELHYLSPEIIRRVNESVGKELVTEVKVGVAPARPSARPGLRGRPEGSPEGTPARTTVRPGQDVDPDVVVGPIGDPALAAATKRALLAAKTHGGKGL